MMLAPKPRPPAENSRTLAWTRFARSADGATAVEFALVAFPFFGLIFAILQIGIIVWSTQVLETAVAAAARQLYTGTFQNAPENAGKSSANLQTAFKNIVCDNVVGVFDCATMVSVDVRTFTGFTGASVPAPVTNGVYDTSSYGYTAPSRNDIVVVRASMQYPNLASMLTPGTVLKNGNQLIVASAAFRAEPF